MLRHIVAWNLTQTDNKEQTLQKIKHELEALPAVITEIVSMEVIINPVGTTNRDVFLTSTFADEAALKAYIIHPEHQRVSDFVKSVTTDRVVLDYME